MTVVSHACVVAANRGKLDALAEHEALAVQLIVPSIWHPSKRERPLRAQPPTDDAYELRVLPTRAFTPALHWYTSGTLHRALSEFGPDLVHVEEEPWSLAALQVALLKKRLQFTLSLFTWENVDRRLPAGARLVQRLVLQRLDRLIAGNVDAAGVMRTRGYEGPIDVLPQHGVEFGQPAAPLDDGTRQALGLRPFVVGFVGRLVPEKGIDTLLDAFASLGTDSCLLVVGEGPLQRRLQQRADALGVGDRVRVVGGVPHDRVPQYLRLMDVLVLPSQTTPEWKEQFGHVLIEAMACGVAVVGSDSGAIPQVIGDAGLVFPERDISALVTCLKRICEPRFKRQLVHLGRRRVTEHYSNITVAREFARVFRTMLPSSGHRQPLS